jgi:hypothetical protein
MKQLDNNVCVDERCADETWTIGSTSEWKEATASIDALIDPEGGLAPQGAGEGQWTSTWQSWRGPIRSVKLIVEAELDLFDNKTIEVVIRGSETPYADASQTPHDWYGRCMIAVIDEHRWIMALRSGLNHISWGKRDTIHLITSNDEGRTWSALNQWFDGNPIAGMPYEDGHTHSEPGLYRTPNGDLILQFWRTSSTSGTKQLRSTDNGKTWNLDIDRIRVLGVTGAEDDRVIGTEDYFIDPDNPSDIYMAFQYFHYNGKAGTLLARSRDNCKNYSFVSWIGPLADEKAPDGGATFEPAIEYVGNRTIVAVLRDAAGNRHTWQSMSTDMGASFSPLVDICSQINGGVPNGVWQRARLYKESNPYFQHGNRLDYSKGTGRLWGFGLHSNGGGYTRKPAVYWSDDNGSSWNGPELLHGPMQPGTDTGYGDLKRRVDNTFVAATYYANSDSTVADVEEYTFGGKRARVMIEFDNDEDGKPDADSDWRELYDGSNQICLGSLSSQRWRLRLVLGANSLANTPRIGRIRIEAWH